MKIRVKELSLEAFSKYGTYSSLSCPSVPMMGNAPIEFYPDLLPYFLNQQTLASLSVCHINKRPFKVDVSEYHRATAEINLPLNGDMLIHVAPSSIEDRLDPESVEAFRVPKGTAVMFVPGVWHHAAFSVDCDPLLVLVLLPQRTYANDCFVYSIPPEEQIDIEL